MADESTIYEDHILRHYEEPHHYESFAGATHRRRVDNPVCGDSVRLEVQVSDTGVIEQAWFTGTGCAISQATASMMMEEIVGKKVDELKEWDKEYVLEMLGIEARSEAEQYYLIRIDAIGDNLVYVDEVTILVRILPT